VVSALPELPEGWEHAATVTRSCEHDRTWVPYGVDGYVTGDSSCFLHAGPLGAATGYIDRWAYDLGIPVAGKRWVKVDRDHWCFIIDPATIGTEGDPP
jgi:hypothetical protein